MVKFTYNANLGREFGKPDLERLGLFVDGPYLYNKNYKSPYQNPGYHQGDTFVTSGNKIKDGTQHGYFDKEFKRIFEGEAYRRTKRKGAASYAPFAIGYRSQKHSTPGDHYGTFNKEYEHFSNQRKPGLVYVSPGKNFVGSNGKEGSYGYNDICLNKFPEAMPDPYMYKKPQKEYGHILNGPYVPVHFPQPCFDKNPFKEDGSGGPVYIDRSRPTPFAAGIWTPNGPGKWQGGCHDGTFNKFPEFMPCKYISSEEANYKSDKDNGIFVPNPAYPKTLYTFSIMQLDTDLGCNAVTYKTYEPKYLQYL